MVVCLSVECLCWVLTLPVLTLNKERHVGTVYSPTFRLLEQTDFLPRMNTCEV